MPYQLLNQGGADAARDVVEQIALGAQHAFKQTAEHPQRKHVEEDVGEPTRVVHEHIGEKLGHVELAPLPEVETQPLLQIDNSRLTECQRCQPHEQINH